MQDTLLARCLSALCVYFPWRKFWLGNLNKVILIGDLRPRSGSTAHRCWRSDRQLLHGDVRPGADKASGEREAADGADA